MRAVFRQLKEEIEDFLFWVAELLCRHSSTEETIKIYYEPDLRREKVTNRRCLKCGKDLTK